MAMFDQKCWISRVIGRIKSTAFPSRQFVSLTDLINIQKLTVAAEIRERISEGKSKIKKSTCCSRRHQKAPVNCVLFPTGINLTV